MEQYAQPEFIFTAAIIIVIAAFVYFRSKKNESDRDSNKSGSLLGQYSTNYTDMARRKQLDPVIGREHEVNQLIQILSRKTKNNALLLGEPGVGKTAIVESLALKIIHDEVPESIAGRDLIALDLSSLVSGTKYRGELEKRLDGLRKEFKYRSKDIIVFIDEIHQLAQASGSEGGLNPGDILKPELARGTLQLIGATTYDEYEKYIVPEESLERRFQPVHIHEPSREETLRILVGVKPVYEAFHHVTFEDAILESIIDLAKKHIHKRYLPDKALDILDEAGVRARLNHMKKRQTDKTIDVNVTVSIDDVKTVIADWAEKPVNQL